MGTVTMPWALKAPGRRKGSGNAQDQAGTNLGGETKVDYPDLATLRDRHLLASRRSRSRNTLSAAARSSSSVIGACSNAVAFLSSAAITSRFSASVSASKLSIIFSAGWVISS